MHQRDKDEPEQKKDKSKSRDKEHLVSDPGGLKASIKINTKYSQTESSDLQSARKELKPESVQRRNRFKHRSTPIQARESDPEKQYYKKTTYGEPEGKKLPATNGDKIQKGMSFTRSQPSLKKKVPNLNLDGLIANKTIPESTSKSGRTKKIQKEESIWDKIIEFQQGDNSIVIPANDDKIRKLLERKVNRKNFRAFAEAHIKDFKARYRAEIGDLSVGKILTDFPDVLEHFVKPDVLDFSAEETETFVSLSTTDNKFKGFKKDILGLLSSKNKNAANYYLRHIESMRKLLRYYTPANSEYVMKLIGKIKYKDIIANSIYMITSVTRFVLKQHSDELKEDASRLDGTYKETEKLLRLLVKHNIILSVDGDKFKTTPDSQAIIFMIFRVWKSVFEITSAPLKNDQKHDSNIKSIKDIHPVKALEYTLNMFIAFSKYMLEIKKKDSTFYYNIRFSDAISHECAILIANNLKSRSLTGAMFEAISSSNASIANSSVNARTFKYKVGLIHKLIDEETGIGGDSQNDVLDYSEDAKYAENDERIKDSIESLLEELTYGRKFVVDKAFTKVLKVDKEGGFAVEKEKVEKEKRSDDKEKRYVEDLELSNVMNAISLAIASEAGIKVNKTELKYLLIAKTLATLLASYLLNTMILKKWFSVPMQILINLHGIDYLSSYLQYYINRKEEQTKAEYHKYNTMDKEFNNTIELLFEQQSIYPILDEGSAIDHILCETNVKIYLGIIAAAFKDTGIELNEVAPQDVSAMAKAMFNELCVYSLYQGQKRAYTIKLDENNIKDIAEGFSGAVSTHLEKKKGSSQYTPTSTPEGFSKKLKNLLEPYMAGEKVEKVKIPSPEESHSSSSDSSLSSSTDESVKVSISNTTKPKKDPLVAKPESESLSNSLEQGLATVRDINRVGSVMKLRTKTSTNPIVELSSVADVKLRERAESPKISPNAAKLTAQSSKDWVNSVLVKSESPRQGKTNSPSVARRSLDGGHSVKYSKSADSFTISSSK